MIRRRRPTARHVLTVLLVAAGALHAFEADGLALVLFFAAAVNEIGAWLTSVQPHRPLRPLRSGSSTRRER
jgi:hypothetical protein